LYGKGWKKIAGLIKTRTVVQIRTHAQKYFLKLTKSRQNVESAGISIDGKPLGQRKKNKRGKERPVALAPSIAPFVRSRSNLALSNGISSSSISSEVVTTTSIDTHEDIIDIDDGLYNFLSPQLFPVLSQSNIDKHTAITQNASFKNNSSFLNSNFPNPMFLAGLGEVVDNIYAISSFDTGDEPNKRSNSLSPTNVATNGVQMFAEKPEWFLRGHNVDMLLKEAEDLNWLSDCGTELPIDAILNGPSSGRNSCISNSKTSSADLIKSHDSKPSLENVVALSTPFSNDIMLPAFDTNDLTLLSHTLDPSHNVLFAGNLVDIESLSSVVTDTGSTTSGTDNTIADIADFWINPTVINMGKPLAVENRTFRKIDSNMCLSEESGSTDESHSTETETLVSLKREREPARNTRRKKKIL
jgi:hypothetical protein